MARCRRSLNITHTPAVTTGQGATVLIPQDVVALTLRVVDSTGAPIAFTVARANQATTVFHFRANEAYDAQDMKLTQDLELKVLSAAGTIELLTWE